MVIDITMLSSAQITPLIIYSADLEAAMILIVADDLLRKFEFHIPATNGDRLSYCINMYCSIMTTQIIHYSSQLTAAIVVVSATHQQLMAAISAITS